MMQRYFSLLAMACFLSASCSKDTGVFNTSVDELVREETDSSQRKYLSFASRNDFSLYVEQLRQGGDGLRSARAYARYVPEGFKSIASLRQEQLRSMSSSTSTVATEVALIDDAPDLESDTEMTSEEFALFRAEELILDSTLRFALDTTLRVEIADSLYAVTEVGTFIAPTIQEEALNKAIEDFRLISQTTDLLSPVVPVVAPKDQFNSMSSEISFDAPKERISELSNTLAKLQPGQVMSVGNSVYYIDSYGVVQNAFQTSSPIVNHSPLIYAPREPELPEFHKNYNVNTYVWKEKTFVGKLLGKVFGHNISRENYFDKRHRVQLVVYDVNLGFFTTTGIKARLQHRKRFLWFNIWHETVAEKLVVGFNQFHAEITDKSIGTKPQNPVALSTLNSFQTTVNGQITDFVTRTYRNIDFIDDWAHDIAALVPLIKVGPLEINPTKAYEFLYNTPRKEIISLLNKNVNHMVFDPLRKKASKEAPRMGFFPNGSGKSQVYGIGVSEYENIKGKSIKLNLAFGLSFSHGGGKTSISPFVPRDVELKAFDVFVSVRRNGVWKGVRFIHNI